MPSSDTHAPGTADAATKGARAPRSPAKVPEITLLFWIVKVLTTGAGESTSDYLIQRLHPAIAVPLAAVGLVTALVLQVSARRYLAWPYWAAVVMVAIFGTMAADVLHGGLGVSYLAASVVLAVLLTIIFAAWYWTERTLAIHSIFTRRREAFYWGTVMATFALGTAAGDLTATTFRWGYFYSGVMFAGAIGVVAVGHYAVQRFASADAAHQSSNAVFAFWLAYILTRPLGASFADWFGKPATQGGLGLGDGTVGLCGMVLICGLVGYMAMRGGDQQSGPSRGRAANRRGLEIGAR